MGGAGRFGVIEGNIMVTVVGAGGGFAFCIQDEEDDEDAGGIWYWDAEE